MAKHKITIEFEVSDYIERSGDSPDRIFRDCVISNALEGSLDALASAYKSNHQGYIDFIEAKAKVIKSVKVVPN